MLGRASSKCLPVCPAISELVQEGQKRLNDVALHRPALSDVLVDGMQYLQRLHNELVVDNQLICALHKESPEKTRVGRTFLYSVSGNWKSRTHSGRKSMPSLSLTRQFIAIRSSWCNSTQLYTATSGFHWKPCTDNLPFTIGPEPLFLTRCRRAIFAHR